MSPDRRPVAGEGGRGRPRRPRMVWQPKNTAGRATPHAESPPVSAPDPEVGRARRAEEERVRAEDERKRVEDERKRATEAAAQERVEARARVDEWRRARSDLMKERAANVSAWENQPVPLPSNLDSSIKKTSAFLRKLRSFSLGGDAQVRSLINEFGKLNLSRYGSEMVSAIVDARLVRSADVNAAVEVSGAIHKRYATFATDLEPGLVRVFDTAASFAKKSEIDKEQASRWRSTLKLLTELFRYGVFQTPRSVSAAIKQLMDADLGSDPSCTILSILIGFCRYSGYDFLGYLPVRLESDFSLSGEDAGSVSSEQPPIIEADIQEKCRGLFNRYFDTLAARFAQVMRDVRQQRKENRRQEFYKGTIDEKNVAALTVLVERFDALRMHLTQLAELLRRDMPEIIADEKEDVSKIVVDDEETRASPSATSLFDDEETNIFYTVLPNLKAMLPAVLLGDTGAKSSDASAQSESVVIDDKDVPVDPDDAELAEAPKQLSPMDLFLQRLPEAMNREQIDELAEKFCYLNNRGTRKRLIEAIYCVNRTRLDLLPYYARLVAILNSCFPDIGSELTRLLKNQFFGLMHHKTQHNIESKIRNVRFIGELVKFGVAHHSLAFNAWNFCLNEFSGQRIPVCCALLEACGRWLFRNPETNERCQQCLTRMMKLKTAKYMDEHANNLIENAYYQCNPPASFRRPRKVLPPLHSYIRHLIYVELNENNVDQILDQLRKLPWSDSVVAAYAKKCLFRADRVQTQNIRYLASIVSGLSKYHGSIAVEIADAVLEEIRQGLERNHFAESQRRLSFARYLAEMYNYMIVNAQTVFDTLYLILTLGHEIDATGNLVSRMDPPTDTFRVSIVCVILDGCGVYFSSGSKRKRLDRLLLFLQRYLILKTVIAADVDFMAADLFDHLAPRLPRYTTLAEVDEALGALDRHGDVDRLVLLHGAQTQALPVGVPAGANESDDECSDDDDESREPIPNGTVEDESESDDDEDDEDDVDDDDDSDDFERRDGGLNPEEKTEEDRSFEMDLERLVLESVEERKFEKRTVQNLTDASAFGDIGITSTAPARPAPRDGENVVFHLLTRKQNKTQTKALTIPKDVDLAKKSLLGKQSAIEEQRTLRQLVIAGMERDHAEEQKRNYYGLPAEDVDSQLDIDLSYRNYEPVAQTGHGQHRSRGGRSGGPPRRFQSRGGGGGGQASR